MYTECPECRTAFRLTAKILKAAQGRVRCGGCGSTFNALDHLAEDLPDDDASSTQTARVFETRSKELLASLDQLAGPGDIRIEDTGVEWRVLDVDDDDSDNDNDADDREPGAIRWSLEEAADTHDPLAETARNLLDGDAATDEDAAGTAPANGTADPEAETARRPLDDDDADAAPGEPASDAAAGAPRHEHDTADETPAAAPADTIDDAPEEDEARAAGDAAAESDVAPRDGDNLRFDDNTPLPDEFFRPVDENMLRQIEAERATGSDDRTESVGTSGNPSAHQADLEFGDDDWEDLLDEVDGDDEAAAATREATGAATVPADAAADTEEADDAGAAADVTAQADSDEHDAAATEDFAETESAEDDLENDQEDDAPAAAEDAGVGGDENDAADTVNAGGDGHSADADAIDPEQSIAMEIDTALMQAVAETAANDTGEAARGGDADDPGDDAAEDTLMESIILEGDTVTGLEVTVEDAAYDDIPPPPDDDEADAARGRWRRVGALAAALVLGLALVAQLVHANRAELATLELFDTAVAPIYRALGQQVTPAWDVRGWRFESTSGSTDGSDQHLTITSRIANRSDGPLPLPLVHVSLTDRYEEVIGSRVLEPAEYLPEERHAVAAVPAGQSFTAVVNVDAPAPDATGFKLNVCYREDGGRLRCAIEDFKRR